MVFRRRPAIARALVNAFGHISQQGIREAQQLRHARIAQLIMHKAAVLLRADQAAITQAGKMVGDVRLREPGGVHNLRHRLRPVA